jgi:hypothetical protein
LIDDRDLHARSRRGPASASTGRRSGDAHELVEGGAAAVGDHRERRHRLDDRVLAEVARERLLGRLLRLVVAPLGEEELREVEETLGETGVRRRLEGGDRRVDVPVHPLRAALLHEGLADRRAVGVVLPVGLGRLDDLLHLLHPQEDLHELLAAGLGVLLLVGDEFVLELGVDRGIGCGVQKYSRTSRPRRVLLALLGGRASEIFGDAFLRPELGSPL